MPGPTHSYPRGLWRLQERQSGSAPSGPVATHHGPRPGHSLVEELLCRPDDAGLPVPCASLPLPALVGVGAKGLCSSLTLSFLSCFKKSLVVYLRETGRKYVPRMPGRCFPSASQRIFSLKGDVSSASWCTTGSGQCHAGPQRPGDRAGQTPDRSSQPCLGRPSLEHRRGGLSLPHTCSEHFGGALGSVGRGCSLGKCGHEPRRARVPEAPTLPQSMLRMTGSWAGAGVQELCCCTQMPPGHGGGEGRGQVFHSLPPAFLLTLVSATESHATLSESLTSPAGSPAPRAPGMRAQPTGGISPRTAQLCHPPPIPWPSIHLLGRFSTLRLGPTDPNPSPVLYTHTCPHLTLTHTQL